MNDAMQIALVVYPGVLNEECEAFLSVLSLMRGADLRTVGARAGSYGGPGGRQHVDLVFSQVTSPDVVVVPGGLGCERAADDPELRRWLQDVEDVAKFVVSSSTGSVVLAAAGLLHGHAAATHWLAHDLLRRYGSEHSGERLVVDGNVVTSEGRLSAVDAAFALVHRIEGPQAVERIRATLIERGEPLLRNRPWWFRALAPVVEWLPRRAAGTTKPVGPGQPAVTPLSVMIELVPNEAAERRRGDSKRRRR